MWEIRRKHDGAVVATGNDNEEPPAYAEDGYSFERIPNLSVCRERSEVGEDLKVLALSLGFCWPDDEVGRWRCLKSMAGMAEYWREQNKKYSTALRRNVEAEKMYAHQQRRLQAMTAKVSNLRKALKEFMSLQMALMREYMASVQPKK